MAATITLHPEFGYVMLVFLLSIFQTVWMAFKVGAARKKYDVKYPDAYSDKSIVFNCTQRVLMNTQENFAQFVTLMLLAALKHPVLSAIGGLIVIGGRFFYAFGYYTGEPAKRSWGAWGHLGDLLHLGCVVSGALSLLGYL